MSLIGISPFDSPTTNLNATGGTKTYFNAYQTTSNPLPPLNAADLRLRLTGSKDSAYTFTLNFNTIASVLGTDLPQDLPVSLTLRRGDANNSGSITIVDALFMAQYLAGIRGLGTDIVSVNSINAASVRQDDATGDKLTIADALILAQMLAGIRGPCYDLIT